MFVVVSSQYSLLVPYEKSLKLWFLSLKPNRIAFDGFCGAAPETHVLILKTKAAQCLLVKDKKHTTTKNTCCCLLCFRFWIDIVVVSLSRFLHQICSSNSITCKEPVVSTAPQNHTICTQHGWR